MLHDNDTTEEYDSSDYDSPSEDEEDDDLEIKRKDSKWPMFDPKCNMFTFQPVEGMRFANPKQLKNYLRAYAFSHGKSLKFVRSSSHFLQVNCKEGCPFKLWASWMKDEKSFQVKTLINKHECSKDLNSKVANAKFLAELYHEQILANPHWRLREFKRDVLQKYGQDVSKTKCYRAKRIALGDVENNLKEHYKRLRDYREELKRSNLGSTVVIQTDRNQPQDTCVFKRMYICFDALKKNWLVGCRPVLGLDGCFLKGFCKGQLLTAIGRDGNNNMFPLAWAVVEGECKDSWMWFLGLLMDDINYSQGHGLTLISDQQKGLMPAIVEMLPLAEHRSCARHIYANLRKKIKGAQYKNIFWKASKSSTFQYHNAAMLEMLELSTGAHAYCMAQNPKAWSRAHFQTFSCCDSVDNNMSETFNGVIVESRSKPIITMLEEIRIYCMSRLHKKREEIEKWKDEICPRMRKNLEKNKDAYRYYDCFYNGDKEFKVRRNDGEGYVVNLTTNSCTCRMWALSGIPCSHAVSVIYYINENPDKYVASWLTKSGTLKAYQYFMRPLNGMALWPNAPGDPILPPKEKRMPGRPKKQRKKDIHEEKKGGRISKKGGKINCGICGGQGHNRKTCKGAASNKQGEDSSSNTTVAATVNASYNQESASNVRKMKKSKSSQPPTRQEPILTKRKRGKHMSQESSSVVTSTSSRIDGTQ